MDNIISFTLALQVWEWLKTKQGQARVNEELKKRKVARSFKISLIDAKIGELKVRG